MKKVGVIILSLIIVIVNAQFGLQLAIYELFKPSIIETFCVNKDVEDSDCEAMCKMSKLAQEDADKSDNHSNKIEHEVHIKFFETSLYIQIESIPIEIEEKETLVYAHYDSALMQRAEGVHSPPPQV